MEARSHRGTIAARDIAERRMDISAIKRNIPLVSGP